ncbi:hypothetical protein BDW02DRAFT_499730, partial [Decorospora gaudefroyi]
VAIADLHDSKRFADELGDASSFYKCDVADYGRQAEIFPRVWDRYGRVDALCRSAGISDKRFRRRDAKVVVSHQEPDLSRTDVDDKGVVYGTQIAIMRNKMPCGKIAAVVNFVRAIARILRNVSLAKYVQGPQSDKKGNITINTERCMRPLPPVSAVMSAYDRFLEDDSLYGKVLECSANKHFFLEPPTLANGRVSRRAVTTWDPPFKMCVRYCTPRDYTAEWSRYLKDSSGLSDAIS